MTQLTYAITQEGNPLSTECPKVDTALTQIKSTVNGNLDTSNLASSLANALLIPTVVAATSATASAGQYVVTTNASATTITLPGHAAGQLVGIANYSTAGTTVSGTSIYGPGLSAVASFPLASSGAFAILADDGASWRMIAGQQDTGWVIVSSFGTNVSQGSPVAAARQVGSTVYLRGEVTISSNLTGGALVFNLPTGIAATSGVGVGMIAGSNGICALNGTLPSTAQVLVTETTPATGNYILSGVYQVN